MQRHYRSSQLRLHRTASTMARDGNNRGRASSSSNSLKPNQKSHRSTIYLLSTTIILYDHNITPIPTESYAAD